MHYPTFWFKLQALERLEKLAQSDDPAVSETSQTALAMACDDLFSSVKRAGAVVPTMLKMRRDHQFTGEKFASSPESAAELLQKLATAEYVDSILADQLTKVSGAEHESARAVQLLGREYAVQLMRGLLA